MPDEKYIKWLLNEVEWAYSRNVPVDPLSEFEKGYMDGLEAATSQIKEAIIKKNK